MALFLFRLVFFSLFPTLALSTTYRPNYQQQGNNLSPKSLQLTVYLHETINKTGYFIVKGVEDPKHLTKILSNSFGSLFAYNDPITETVDPSSKLLGYMEGSAVTTSFDGERVTCISRTILNLKGYKGELLNVGSAHFVEVSELALVGGTGDFRFAQGYMTKSVVQRSGPTTSYKVEFYLYWPHAVLAH